MARAPCIVCVLAEDLQPHPLMHTLFPKLRESVDKIGLLGNNTRSGFGGTSSLGD
jgi:hypothetical protein